jgi:hypothetical protein
MLFDTDGDGADDEVTAYGAADDWRIRVVENGIVSEAVMPAIEGWAHLGETVAAPQGWWVTVVDADTADVYTFDTGDDGCVAQLDGPGIDSVEDLGLSG